MLNPINESTISIKKKEIGSFLLAVVVISFSVNSISSIFFAIFFPTYTLIFSILTALICVISILGSFAYLLSGALQHYSSSTPLLFFNIKRKLFIFSKYSVISASLNYDLKYLERSSLAKIKAIKNHQDYHKSTFGKFVHQFVQKYILTELVSGNIPYRGDNSTEYKIADLPSELHDNPLLAKNSIDLFNIVRLPSWVKVSVLKDDQSGTIALNSIYGKCKISYLITFFTTLTREIDTVVEHTGEKHFSIKIHFMVSSSYNPLRIYSKKMELHDLWVSSIHEKTKKLNSSAADNSSLIMLESIFRYLQKKK